MNFARLLAFGFILFACQPNALPTITIIDNDKIIRLQSAERLPSTLLKEAGITLNPKDCVLLDGLPIAPDQAINNSSTTLQVRRAVTLTLFTADGEKSLQSSASLSVKH
jgi:hypothetical protein